jgi:uncharacterized protein YraI
METEVSLRKRLDGLAESSRYDSAKLWASPVAQMETSPPANTKVSFRVRTLYTDENNPPQLSQHTDLSRSQRSFGSDLKLITGIAVVLTLGLSAFAYFFLASPSEKTTTQTAKLAQSVPYPPATPAEAAPSAAPAVATPSAAPAAAAPSAALAEDAPSAAPATATASAAPPAATLSAAPSAVTASAAPAAVAASAAPEPVQASHKVAQSGDVLYLQRPGVNIRSTPSPTGSAVGTAPKGTRFKVTNQQGDWIQVESGRLKGWINAGFLAPSAPR